MPLRLLGAYIYLALYCLGSPVLASPVPQLDLCVRRHCVSAARDWKQAILLLFPSKVPGQSKEVRQVYGWDQVEAERLVHLRDGRKNGWVCPVLLLASVFHSQLYQTGCKILCQGIQRKAPTSTVFNKPLSRCIVGSHFLLALQRQFPPSLAGRQVLCRSCSMLQ